MRYDYLVVGAGLFGATFAQRMKEKGKRCLVIDRRDHVGGNAYTREVEGINVHVYGAHIFHTSDDGVWEYVNRFARFNHYVNSPIARIGDETYNMPFNMNTFSKMWGVATPEEAKAKIRSQIPKLDGEPRNLEEQALSLVGRDVYEKLVKGYTEKQWGRPCDELPAFIIRRLPLRFIYDNNYFNDPHQGIPIGGYTKMVERMLEGIDVKLNCDFFKEHRDFKEVADKLLYTGMIDEYFDYRLGHLEYRSLRFESETLDEENHQGVAVVNYTGTEVPYTRVIEHKHFEFGKQSRTVVTKEYPQAWEPGLEAYYPMNDERNNALYEKYRELAEKEEDVIFGGRLGLYKYFDMDKTISAAIALCQNI
ncbi:MAG: UDP-galactopyranose mutase [Thermoplasmatales archaeon]|nr:UDP-galactopyranose mutase [Thermoplasmatales archaeon]